MGESATRSQTVKVCARQQFSVVRRTGSLIGGMTGNALQTPTLDGRALAVMAGARSPMTKAESNRNHCLKWSKAVWRQTVLPYKPRVYKIPGVRMFALAGGPTNLRMYRSKRRPRRNVGALMRSRCGLVEIDPTNDHAVLQAQASRQYDKRPYPIIA